MTYLSPSEMPMSIQGRALLWCAKTNFMNPPNAEQSRLSRACKPLRCILRLVYYIGVSIIAPFLSVINFTLAFAFKARSLINKSDKTKLLAREYFNAGCHDLFAPFRQTLFYFYPNQCVWAYQSSSYVRVKPLDDENIRFVEGNLIDKIEHGEHQRHQEKMNQGLFVYHELVMKSLNMRNIATQEQFKKYDGFPIDSTLVKEACFQASYLGKYIPIKHLFAFGYFKYWSFNFDQ